MTPTPSKKPWQSRTLWFNIFSIIAVVLVQFQQIPGIPQSWVPYLAVAIPAVNMLLRVITTQPLSIASGPATPLDPDGTPIVGPGTRL